MSMLVPTKSMSARQLLSASNSVSNGDAKRRNSTRKRKRRCSSIRPRVTSQTIRNLTARKHDK